MIDKHYEELNEFLKVNKNKDQLIHFFFFMIYSSFVLLTRLPRICGTLIQPVGV